MANFETRVINKISDTLTTGDLTVTTDMLDVWLGEGARYIIGKMPPMLWKYFSKEDAAFAPTTGLAVENHKIINVFRNDGTIDQPARQIPESLRGRALDSSDINYATNTDPEWYIDSSTTATPTLKILPVSATAVGKVIRLSYPTIDASADSSINGFPDELEDLVVLYAVLQAKLREMGLSRRDAQTEIEAITDSGILSSLSGVYTEIETALDAAKTELDKVPTLHDNSQTELA